MRARWRCFVAIPLSDGVERALQRTADALGRSASACGLRLRLIAPECRHLTLSFLGEIEEDRARSVAAVLEPPLARTSPFACRLSGLTALPLRGAPRAVAVSVDPEDRAGRESLEKLFAGVRSALEPLGFERERRRFRPHVTLARIRDSGGWRRWKSDLEEFAGRRVGTLEVDRVTLFRSHLSRTGARYEPLRTYRLEAS